ncbi:MAG TPA: hypothetical protein VJW20_08205 [Candidatus Angelobacter sp.]|nr:hypothetical protein [Candidatus Angelobacter sp.]
MLKQALFLAILLAGVALAQQEQPTPQSSENKPQVKVNYLNVCTPGKEEQEVINGALAAVKAKPVFSTDFEISRGRTTLKDAPDSRFVRLRRDFAADSPLMTAQYSMSTDSTNTIETLVLHPRDTKDFLELVLEDRVSAGSASPAIVLSVDTPATRVRIERLNKSSAVLTRCPDADQSAYDPVFRQASEIMAQYRAALGLRTEFRSDIAWLNPAIKKTGVAQKRKKQPSAKP